LQFDSFISLSSFAETRRSGSRDPPVADDQSVTTDEDTAKDITLTATDNDGDSLTYVVVDGPAHGTLTGTATALTYTPAGNYSGPDSFTFKTNDGQVDSNTATVSIEVTPVNDAPVADNQSVTIVENTAASITLIAADIDGDLLTYLVVAGPFHGTLTGIAPGLTYTPVSGYNGLDSFTFVANDGTMDSNVATVTITVNPVQVKPIVITSPNGGENWEILSAQTITWDSTSVLFVKIELSRDGGATWTTIAASIANHGSKSWKVTGPATTHARIRVASLSNSASDISNADFTITAD